MRKPLSEIKSWRKDLTIVLLVLISLAAIILTAVLIIDPLMPGSYGYAALVAMVVMMGVAIFGAPVYIGLYFLYPAKWVKYWVITLFVLGLAFLAYILLYNTMH